MLGMTALVEEGQVRSLASENADEYIRLVLLAKVTAKTTLPVMNRFHGEPPVYPLIDKLDGIAVAFRIEDS